MPKKNQYVVDCNYDRPYSTQDAALAKAVKISFSNLGASVSVIELTPQGERVQAIAVQANPIDDIAIDDPEDPEKQD